MRSCTRVVGAGLIVALSTCLTPLRARAQAVGGVSTRVDACVPLDRERFAQLLAIELDTAVGRSNTADDSAAARVTLSCVAGQIEIRLDDAVTRKSMTRLIDLQRVAPSARDRMMALTVAELVLASWLEVRLFESVRIEPVGPAPPAAITRSASALVDAKLGRSEPPQLGAAVEALAFSSAFKLIPCLALRLTQPVSTRFAFRVGIQAGRSSLEGKFSPSRPPVSVRITVASLLAALLYRMRFDDLDLAGGLGVRLGFVVLAGVQPSDRSLVTEQSYAPWAGPLVTAEAGYRVSPHVRIALALESGFTALQTRAVAPNGVAVVELRSVWGGASLGIDWLF